MTTAWDQRLGFWWIAEDHPDTPAVLAGPDGARTYAELAGDAHQLVHLFRSFGAEPGDAIAAIVDNGTTLIEVSLACQQAGFYFIPLNTHLTAFELAAILEHSGAKVLIVDERFAPQLADIDPALEVTVLAAGTIDGVARSPTPAPSMPRTTPHRSHARRAVRLHLRHHRQAEGHPPTAAGGRRRRGRQHGGPLRPCLRFPTVRRSDARVDRDVPRRLAQLLHGWPRRLPFRTPSFPRWPCSR